MQARNRWPGVLAAAALLMSALAAASPASAGRATIEICHDSSNGSYRLINVPSNAVNAHVDHGDASPGEYVPGVANMVFDSNCGIVAPPNEPPILTAATSVSVLETLDVTGFITNLQASDPEGETDEGGGLVYSLSGPDAALFSLDEQTGIIAFLSQPDFENPTDVGGDSTYNITGTVTDSGGLSDSGDIAIEVRDVNEAPTIVAPSAVTLDENTTSVADINASDPDGETEGGGGLSYALSGGSDAALFAIDATGALTFITSPDFEAPTDDGADNVYEVSLIVTDGGGLTDGARLSITVADTNEDSDQDGFDDATDNCPTVPNADQLDQYGNADGDACEDTDGDGIFDVDEEHICVLVSIGTTPSNRLPPVVVLQAGSASCIVNQLVSSYELIVNGEGSSVQSGNMHDTIITVIGANSSASNGDGSGNRISIIGNNSTAKTGWGNFNTAIVMGDNGSATANNGDRNRATSNGNCAVSAGGPNSATLAYDQVAVC